MDRVDQLAGVLQAALIAGAECAAGKCVGQNRLLDTLLRASNLGGVPRNEVVPNLVGRQLGDGRQDAECIAGEQVLLEADISGTV